MRLAASRLVDAHVGEAGAEGLLHVSLFCLSPFLLPPPVALASPPSTVDSKRRAKASSRLSGRFEARIVMPSKLSMRWSR